MLKEIEPESKFQKIVSEEEEILAEVLKRLVEFLERRSRKFSGKDPTIYQNARQQLLELRDLIAEAKPHDIPALTDQMHHLSALANRIDPDLTVPANPDSPYFAHIQLEENQKRRDVLIGKRSFVDSHNRINIVDWRNAPVSRLYYNYEEGSEYDIVYGEREIEGILRLKRSLAVQNGQLKRIIAPQGHFLQIGKNGTWSEQTQVPVHRLHGGQGKAKRAPSQRRRLGTGDDSGYRVDKHLPEIAALLDPQQFEQITRPESGLIILQGGAGSGKTTIALHRVAYLNYQNKNRHSGNKVLITVFNPALARYIERVLPDLEVRGIRVWTYSAWVSSVRRKLLPHLPKKEWADPPDPARRLKKHPAMMQILKNYVSEQTKELQQEFQERLSPFSWKNWQKNQNLALIPRLNNTLQNLNSSPTSVTDDLVLKKALKRAKDIYSDWAEIVTDPSRLCQGFQNFGENPFTEHQWQQIIRYCSRQISEIPKGEEKPLIPEDEADETGLLDNLDNTLLLRLAQLKYGGLILPSGKEVYYNHSVIDEAQDLSPLEIQVILEATNQESVTLAGDTAQKLIFDNGFNDWPGLLRALGKEAIQIEPLKIGYRSTDEINNFARKILGPLAAKEPLQSKRSGVPVEVFTFSEMGQTVAFLTETLRSLVERERMANIALLTLLPSQADLFYQALKGNEIPALRRIQNQDFSFTPGIDLTDISQVKGLEYDYVVILDASSENYPDTKESRHLLHIAATRAAHQLWLLATGKPSPLIPQQYIVEI